MRSVVAIILGSIAAAMKNCVVVFSGGSYGFGSGFDVALLFLIASTSAAATATAGEQVDDTSPNRKP